MSNQWGFDIKSLLLLLKKQNLKSIISFFSLTSSITEISWDSNISAVEIRGILEDPFHLEKSKVKRDHTICARRVFTSDKEILKTSLQFLQDAKRQLRFGRGSLKVTCSSEVLFFKEPVYLEASS